MKTIVVFRTEGQAFGVAEAEEFDGDLADDLFRLVLLAYLPTPSSSEVTKILDHSEWADHRVRPPLECSDRGSS